MIQYIQLSYEFEVCVKMLANFPISFAEVFGHVWQQIENVLGLGSNRPPEVCFATALYSEGTIGRNLVEDFLRALQFGRENSHMQL